MLCILIWLLCLSSEVNCLDMSCLLFIFLWFFFFFQVPYLFYLIFSFSPSHSVIHLCQPLCLTFLLVHTQFITMPGTSDCSILSLWQLEDQPFTDPLIRQLENKLFVPLRHSELEPTNMYLLQHQHHLSFRDCFVCGDAFLLDCFLEGGFVWPLFLWVLLRAHVSEMWIITINLIVWFDDCQEQ